MGLADPPGHILRRGPSFPKPTTHVGQPRFGVAQLALQGAHSVQPLSGLTFERGGFLRPAAPLLLVLTSLLIFLTAVLGPPRTLAAGDEPKLWRGGEARQHLEPGCWQLFREASVPEVVREPTVHRSPQEGIRDTAQARGGRLKARVRQQPAGPLHERIQIGPLGLHRFTRRPRIPELRRADLIHGVEKVAEPMVLRSGQLIRGPERRGWLAQRLHPVSIAPVAGFPQCGRTRIALGGEPGQWHGVKLLDHPLEVGHGLSVL